MIIGIFQTYRADTQGAEEACTLRSVILFVGHTGGSNGLNDSAFSVPTIASVSYSSPESFYLDCTYLVLLKSFGIQPTNLPCSTLSDIHSTKWSSSLHSRCRISYFFNKGHITCSTPSVYHAPPLHVLLML